MKERGSSIYSGGRGVAAEARVANGAAVLVLEGAR